MPPKRLQARSSGYVFCDHCNKVVCRQTAYRHQLDAQQAAALAATIPLPPTTQPASNDDDSPPLGDISLTLSEQALSDFHMSDLDDSDDDLANLRIALQPRRPPSEAESDDEMQELSLLYEDMQVEDTAEDAPVADAEPGDVP
ncbi:hypothetical protein M407DRAFT_32809, partial [Tulasnella calospora MUT 4182]